MPDLLALEWDHERIFGVLAQVSPGRVLVRRKIALQKPSSGAVAESGLLPIGWLKTELGKLGVAGGQVLVTLPRDEAIVKRLELPETSDDELPLIVKFQAGAKSSTGLDELFLDFIPHPRRVTFPGREVLTATVPRQTVEEIRTLLAAAGLQLASLSLTPVAVAELVARAEQQLSETPGESLVIARHGMRVEISVLRRQHLLFSHSARLYEDAGGQEPQAIAAEVSRALVALRGAMSDVKIERAWTMVGPAEHTQLAEALRRRINCDAQALDPFSLVDWEPGAAGTEPDHALFAGALGMLLSRAEAKAPTLDFLAPRQPVVKRDDRKRRLAIIGGVAAAVVALLAGLQYMEISDLQQRIDDLTKEQNDLTAFLKKGDPLLLSTNLVKKWEAEETPWLDELQEFSQRMPSSDRVYLTALKFDPKSASSPAHIRVDGYARERDDVMKMGAGFLSDDEKYRILPHGARATTTDKYFPWQFDAELLVADLSKRPKGAAGKEAKPAPATGTAKAEVKPAVAAPQPAASQAAAPAPSLSQAPVPQTPSSPVPTTSTQGAVK